MPQTDSTREENPYAVPKADLTTPNVNQHMAHTDGVFLYAKHGAELPPYCPITNEPVPLSGWRRREQISYCPRAFIVFRRHSASINYSLSEKALHQINKHRLFSFLYLILLVAGAAILPSAMNLLVFILIAIPLLIAMLFHYSKVVIMKPVGYDDGWFKISGCSKEFLTNLPPRPEG